MYGSYGSYIQSEVEIPVGKQTDKFGRVDCKHFKSCVPELGGRNNETPPSRRACRCAQKLSNLHMPQKKEKGSD